MNPASLCLLFVMMIMKCLIGFTRFIFAAVMLFRGHREKYPYEKRPWDLPGIGAWKKR